MIVFVVVLIVFCFVFLFFGFVFYGGSWGDFDHGLSMIAHLPLSIGPRQLRMANRPEVGKYLHILVTTKAKPKPRDKWPTSTTKQQVRTKQVPDKDTSPTAFLPPLLYNMRTALSNVDRYATSARHDRPGPVSTHEARTVMATPCDVEQTSNVSDNLILGAFLKDNQRLVTSTNKQRLR